MQPRSLLIFFNLDTSPPVSGPPEGTKSPFFYYVGAKAFKLEHELESESPGGLCAHRSLGILPRVLDQKVWGWAWRICTQTSSQGMLMLQVSGPNLGTTDAEQFYCPFIPYSMASSFFFKGSSTPSQIHGLSSVYWIYKMQIKNGCLIGRLILCI